jgi:hypothetical protein
MLRCWSGDFCCACRLPGIYVSTDIDPQLKDPHRLPPARRRSQRQLAELQCFGAGLKNFVFIVYCACMLPGIYVSITSGVPNLGRTQFRPKLTHACCRQINAVNLYYFFGKQCYIGSTTQIATLLHKKGQERMGQPVLTPTPQHSPYKRRRHKVMRITP